jgi:predicted TIM-barrel fold metal-dependent hydrolase
MRIALLLAATIILTASPLAQSQPSTDYHQHLFSPASHLRAPQVQSFSTADLIPLLDAAGIKRAVILSLAYQYSNPNLPPIPDEYTKVRAENDWTAQQVAQFPGRLWAFCSVNPLKSYALQEIERCSHDPYLRTGLKMHFGNSDVDLDNPQHLAQLRRIFAAADQRHMAIVVHMHSSVTRKRPYGAKEARVFLTQLLAAAPHVTIQIAHLTGSGTYDDPATDQALSVFIEAIRRHDPHMQHVYFDISGVAGFGHWAEKKNLIATRIRQIGVHRILWGSDSSYGGGLTPLETLRAYQALPLTKQEFHTIDSNIPPYLH